MTNAQAVQTYQLGLIGYPLSHSLSPALHRAALRAHGLPGDYELFPVAPEHAAGLAALTGRVRSGELAGLNVTIPHKQAVIRHLDALTPSAQAIGAVNTIFLRNGQLTGDNTDAPAFLSDLHARLFPIPSLPRPQFITENHKSALVLGAGGAARAVVYALIEDGWEVIVAARRSSQGAELARTFMSVRAVDLKSILPSQPSTLSVSGPQLIVNATPVGMFPHTDASPWPDGEALPPEARVYDLVYNPRETLLVRRARAAGLRAVTGLGMLAEQAALAFELWTGRHASRDVMMQALNQS